MNLSPLSRFLAEVVQPLAPADDLRDARHGAPLLLAFHAYELAQTVQENLNQARSDLRNTLERKVPAGASPLERAWTTILNSTARLTQSEFESLRVWLFAEAERRGLQLTPPTLADMSFRTSELDPHSMQMFHGLFADFVPHWAASPPLAPPATATARGAVDSAPVDIERALFKVIEPDVDATTLPSEIEGLAERLLARMPAIVAAAERVIGTDGPPGMLFDEFRTSQASQVIVAPAEAAREPLWMIGDVHGDLLGLETILHYVRRCTPEGAAPNYLFLGDLFDDGPYGAEVMLRVLELLVDDKSRVGWLAGNHDESLQADAGFSSTVAPCEFSEWLNAHRDEPGVAELGKLIVALVRRLPRLIFLPDGLFAAHGGVPHVDLQTQIQTVEDLNRFECQQDLVWTRLHERAKRRIPNRSTRGCELGRDDFASFCEHMEVLLQTPLRGMIRGHDHIDDTDRYRVFQQYRPKLVATINTMCHRLEREAFGQFVRRPCVARWKAGEPLELHCLTIPDRLVRQMYQYDAVP